MKKIIFFLFFGLILANLALAQNQVDLYLFYGEGCPHCAKARPYLESLKEKYPSLKIYQYEVWQDPVNQQLFQKMAEAYNEQPQGVPTVFIGDKVIVGYDESMDDQYIQAIDYCLKNNCPSPGEKLNGVTGNSSNDSSGQAQKQQASQNSTQQPQASQNSQRLFWLIIGFVFLLFAGFILFPRKKKLTMKKFYFLSIIFFIIFIPNLVLAEEQSCQINLPCSDNNQSSSTATATDNLKPSSTGICIYFFYGNGCPHCAEVEPLVKELAKKYPEVQLKELEIYYNEANRQKLLDFYFRFQVLEKNQVIPAVFIGDQSFIGAGPIKDNLEKQIKYYIEHGPICPETVNKNKTTGGGPFSGSPVSVTLGTVTVAALIDSINPCAFSVLIFLLVYLLAIKAERRLLKIGIVYVVTVFLVYFFSGLGFFAIIQATNITRVIIKIAAVLAILAGLINVKDFFWPNKGPSLKIPESKKPVIEKYIKQATLPAAIVLGFLVSLFELPCTGSVYLAILSLLANKMTKISAIPYLLYYNFLFVLPLLIILFLVAKGFSPERLEKWRQGSRGWLRLIMGLVLVFLGLAMILGII